MEKKTVDDSDYDYADMDQTDAYGEGAGQVKPWDKFKHKNAFIALGVIILILAIYKLLGVFFSAGPQKPTQPPVAEHKVPTVNQTINRPVTNEVNEKLAIMENRNSENRQKLEQNAIQVAKIETDVANLQVQVNLINTTLQDIAKQLKQQKAPKKKIVAKKQQQVVKPKTQYYVQAIVPERAWLKTADGSTLTVSRGDDLPGYGVIGMIDVSAGTVTTSTGHMITYHPNDK